MRYFLLVLSAVLLFLLTGCPSWFGDSTPPGDVTELEGTGENGTVILTWTNPPDDDVDTITVDYGSEPVSVSAGSTSASIEGLTDGTEYTFTVKVSDTSGNLSPGVSISITPSDTVPPGKAADLSGVPEHESVTLTWTDPADNDLDRIEITWSPAGGTVQAIEPGTETYTAAGLVNGTEYTFTIVTVDNAGNTSSGVDISETPIDTLPPAEVTDTDAAVRSRKIILSWSDPDDEDFDHVEISRTPGGETPQTITSGTETYTASGLSNGTEYTFSLKTVDTKGNTSSGINSTAAPRPTYVLSGSWQSTNSGDTFTRSGAQSSLDGHPLFEQERDYAPSGETAQIIIRYKDDMQRTRSLSERIERYGSETVKMNKPGFSFSVIKLANKTVTVQEALDYYNGLPEVQYAEPDYLMYALDTVNDPLYSYQWHFIQLQMPNVWGRVIGDSSVTVAVVDTGIASDLSDLTGTTILTGWDFVNGDSDPYDDNNHGTHVAGTIAQSTNNDAGTAGMAYGVTLLHVKVLGQDGTGWTSDIVDGIIWAADEGAQIINLSLGSSELDQTLYDACEYAYNSGAALFAASGNENGSVLYPAAIDNFVVAVGATDYGKDRAPYSNYGPELDIVAPGGDLLEDQNGDTYADGILQQTIAGYDPDSNTTDYTPNYYFFQGTSMACPHVAALAALILINQPDATNSQIYDTILGTADDLGSSGRDDYYGYGLINPMAALDVGIQIYIIDDSETVHYSDGSTVLDEWIINANSGTYNIDISINFDNNDGDLDLFLYDQQNTLVKSSQSSLDQETISCYVGSQGGTYTVKIEGNQ